MVDQEPKRVVVNDKTYGEGYRLDGVWGVKVEVFPTAGVTRLTTNDARLVLYGRSEPRMDQGRLVFDSSDHHEDAGITQRQDGTLIGLFVREDLEQVQRRATGETRRAEHPRVEMTGRIGKTPLFHRSRRRTLVGRFPLEIYGERGQTTFRRILIFGERAERLQEEVRDGAIGQYTEVDVIGYLHEKQVRGRKGSRPVQEIYAVVITPTQKT